ncbi:MAG: MATE family efflux transporter [Oscillospiraceae bacterium]|nr:MATE family efflux transporter [Oscillospiraceae bacterium]
MKVKQHGLDLTQGRISTLLIKFAAPFVLANMVNALHGIIGTIIVGQFADFQTLAGVGVGTQVLNLTFPFVAGLGTGATVIIGRYVGERNADRGTKATGSIFVTSAVIIAIITLITLFVRELMLDLLNTQPDMRESASRFVLIGTAGIPFNIGFAVVSAIFRGMGNSNAPSVVAGISAAVNIALSILLAGVLGVAADISVVVAMVSAQFVSFVLIAVWLYVKKLPFPFSKKDVRADKESMTIITKIGGPLVVTDILIMSSFMIVMSQVNSISTEASAAVSLVNRAFPAVFAIPMGISAAVSAMTAQNLGAGKHDRAVGSMRWGIAYALGLALVFVALLVTIPEIILSVFTTDQVIIGGAASYLRAFVIDLVFMSLVFCLNAYFVGSGKSQIQMIHSLVGAIFIRVPLNIYVARMEGLALNTQLSYLGLTVPAAGLASLIICVGYFLWQNKKYKAESQRLDV